MHRSGLQTVLKNEKTGYRNNVLAKTADYTLTIDDNGALFTNDGASGTITLSAGATGTLPVGFNFTVYALDDQDVRFDPEDASSIKLTGATPGAGKYISADTQLDAFQVAKVSSTEWVVVHYSGTLAVEA